MTSFLNKTAGRVKENVLTQSKSLVRTRGAEYEIKKTAFTLAEVLVTLGIIGVVAALTIPSLIQNHREKETVAKLKKAYSVTSQAYLLAKNEFGPFSDWGITTTMSEPVSHIKFANNMKKYMNLSQDCVGLSQSEVYKKCTLLDSARIENSASIRLADGTAVFFRTWSGECSHNYSLNGNKSLKKVCGSIGVSLHPNKKSNTAGKDYFSFYMTEDGVIPFGVQDDQHLFSKACDRNAVSKPYPGFSDSLMFACTAWVVLNDNMDYLHCDGLDWNGKTKCN